MTGVHLVKAAIEYQTCKDTAYCSKAIAKDVDLKHETKIKHSLTEEVEDERKLAYTKVLNDQVNQNCLLIH